MSPTYFMWKGIEEGNPIAISIFTMYFLLLLFPALMFIEFGGLWLSNFGILILVLLGLILKHFFNVLNTKPKEK